MKGEGVFWMAAAGGAVLLGLLVALGAAGGGVILLAVLGTILMAALGWTMRRSVDASWLPAWVTLGFMAKIGGAVARAYMVEVVYEGGDSFRYYDVGIELAAIWRSGTIPDLTGRGSFGTQVTEAVTGGMFALFTPDFVGGFVMFSILAFVGQLGMYAAFRRWGKPHQLKPYAFLILFLPTYAFWPSSIGKDALVIMWLGLAAYATARLLERYQFRWTFALGVALAGLGLIRVHVAGIVAASLVGAVIVSKLRAGSGGFVGWRRLLTLAGAAVVGYLVVGLIPFALGIDTAETDDLAGFTDEIVRRTSDGTIAAGDPVRNPLDVPGAVALVLYRPTVFEATEVQHTLAALETAFLALLTLWKLPAIIRNRHKWRSNAYFVFSSIYVVAFAIAFSVVRNLGIIARQRGQVLAFFLCVIIGLGWEDRKARRSRPSPALVQQPVQSLGPAAMDDEAGL